MTLDQWPEPSHQGFVQAVGEDHAVRVADGDGRHQQGLPVHLERHAHGLARRPVHRDLGGHEGAASHLHRDDADAALLHVAAALDAAALGGHGEGVARSVPVVAQVLGEDAEPIPRLLGLAPVGIQDAQAEVGAVPGRHLQQNAVGSHAPVPIADSRDLPGLERARQVGGVDDDVVVARARGP